MQSFIIVSKNPQGLEKEWGNLCKKFGVETIDQMIISSENALGIEEIRNIQKSIFLTPVKGKKKAILVKNAQTLTIPAQNAFLKLLEEPPSHAVIVLQTTSKDLLLPTILSRCFLIETVPTSNTDEIELVLDTPLETAQRYGKSRDEALAFLQTYIAKEREALLSSAQTRETVQKLRKLQEAYTIITTTNVNPRFTLENTLFELE